VNAYIDSSVLLREIFEQSPQLAEWHRLIVGVTSELARVECFRSVDRLRLLGKMNDHAVAKAHETIRAVLGRLDVLPVESGVLAHASQALPTPLATLDAIHLSTALMYRERQPESEPPIFFATFDIALAEAARATGFRVIGL
jgi:predicted nucleic acid-binding protein